MKGFWKLDWLKWLPLIGSVFFSILFLVEYNRYCANYGADGFRRINSLDTDEMLFWGDFFSGVVSITLVVSVVCSFFIKNKWLKWLSVITGIAALIFIFQNVGKFNPY